MKSSIPILTRRSPTSHLRDTIPLAIIYPPTIPKRYATSSTDWKPRTFFKPGEGNPSNYRSENAPRYRSNNNGSYPKNGEWSFKPKGRDIEGVSHRKNVHVVDSTTGEESRLNRKHSRAVRKELKKGIRADSEEERSNADNIANYSKNYMNAIQSHNVSTTVYRSPLMKVQYCTAILLLRTFPVLLNPFHPLLRTALQKHEENHEIGYFLHMHTSSKNFTGKQATVRKVVRAKTRSAWETVLADRGYDVKTGRFVQHLKPDWHPSRGDIRQQDIKGTITLHPSEACKSARFEDLLRECEKGLNAVLESKQRDYRMENMMQPSNLWRFYDWKRRLLLKRYVEMGYGLSIQGQLGWRFREAIEEVRGGGDPGVGVKGEGGEYLVEMEGKTLDIGPLKRRESKAKQGFGLSMNSEAKAEMPGAPDDAEMDKLFGDIMGEEGEEDPGSGGLDWGLDDMGNEEEDDSDDDDFPTKPKGNKKVDQKSSSTNSIQYNDDF
ncbi:hypothetical protein TWF694_007944 [Orbilia ellipsospora]|uniref:Uncharacterized protein n=1 Tax=Orbilia ellipsospora TaxID=2528407 RepID=A0AAV9XKY1_9PEZI